VTFVAAIGLVLAMVALGLGLANALRDRGAPQGVTRWIASVVGGFAYLLSVFWLDAGAAIVLSAICAALIAAMRFRHAGLLRGLRTDAGEASRAELGYPAAATTALVVGWAMLGNPWLSFVAIAFMAWGDASAGLARMFMANSRYQTLAALATMLSVSVVCAWLFYPTTASLAAAVTASAAEAMWPLTGIKISDNWAVVGSATAVMMLLGGNL